MVGARAAKSQADVNGLFRPNGGCLSCGAALRSTNERAANLCAYHLYVSPSLVSSAGRAGRSSPP